MPEAIEGARLTDEQRKAFEQTGFLVVEEALPADLTTELRQRSLALYEADRREREIGPHDFWQLRNCLLHDDTFLQLLDWPSTFPLVVDLLGWNVQLSTSHLTVLPPAQRPNDPAGPLANARGSVRDPSVERGRGGWHRDGGTSSSEMTEPHPRLWIKIGYWLSDTSDPASGAMRIIPGSHRMTGRPPTLPGSDEPVGAFDLRCRPGTAVLFEQRTWHCRGENNSDETRVGLFIGYSYRWIRPMDYVQMPEELLARCSSVRRQLLGDARTQMGYYLPTDEDVPLKEWAVKRVEG